VVEIHIEVK